MLILNLIVFVTIALSFCLICKPIAFRWDWTIKGGSCGDEKPLDLYASIINLILDALVVILPMPSLWGLQMPLRRKLGVCCLFGLGTA